MHSSGRLLTPKEDYYHSQSSPGNISPLEKMTYYPHSGLVVSLSRTVRVMDSEHNFDTFYTETFSVLLDLRGQYLQYHFQILIFSFLIMRHAAKFAFEIFYFFLDF